MNKPDVHRCPHCEGTELFHQKVDSAGGFGPWLLPGLASVFDVPKFHLILCACCGHLMFFAEKHRLARITEKRSGWNRLNAPDDQPA